MFVRSIVGEHDTIITAAPHKRPAAKINFEITLTMLQYLKYSAWLKQLRRVGYILLEAADGHHEEDCCA